MTKRDYVKPIWVALEKRRAILRDLKLEFQHAV